MPERRRRETHRRRARVFKNRSMLNRAGPDFSPWTQNSSDTRKRGTTRFHKNWDASMR